MINNIERVLPLLTFKDKNDFYFLQILQRKKENPKLGSNSRVIKNYYIRSVEELQEKYSEIMALCEIFNARAMLRLNKRNFKKVAHKTSIKMPILMEAEDYAGVKKAYDKACGKGHDEKDNKKWIIDIDGEFDDPFIVKLQNHINNLQPMGEKIVALIPSKYGIHIICNPFNTSQWKDLHPNIEIHRDNPTNLFIP